MRFTTAEAFHAYVAEHGPVFTDWLSLARCTGLTSLPDNLRAERIDLLGCTGLTALSDNLRAVALYLNGCTGLTSLPDGLNVNYLGLYGCTGLFGPQRWRGKAFNLQFETIGLPFSKGQAIALFGKPRRLGQATVQRGKYFRAADWADMLDCYVATVGAHTAYGNTVEQAIADAASEATEATKHDELIAGVNARGVVTRDEFWKITGACDSELADGLRQCGLDPHLAEMTLDQARQVGAGGDYAEVLFAALAQTV
jgi:hypothetical protein